MHIMLREGHTHTHTHTLTKISAGKKIMIAKII